jgi:hypothetical protein
MNLRLAVVTTDLSSFIGRQFVDGAVLGIARAQAPIDLLKGERPPS